MAAGWQFIMRVSVFFYFLFFTQKHVVICSPATSKILRLLYVWVWVRDYPPTCVVNTIIQPVIYFSYDANLCTQGPQKLSELSRVTVTTNGSLATDELAAPYLVRGGGCCVHVFGCVCVYGGDMCV